MQKIKTIFTLIALLLIFQFPIAAQTVPETYGPELIRLAESGNAEAQLNLGWCYENGEGVPQDYIEAVKWYRKAAEKGHPEAQYFLGTCYEQGVGVPQDYAESMKWIKEAALQGYPRAQFHYGWLYAGGEFGVIDDVEAIKWYRKAAEQGIPEAQYLLGYNYYTGESVPRNDAEAVKYFTMFLQNPEQNQDLEISEELLSSVYIYLAECYRFGRGVAADERKADEYTSKAAELGDPHAQKLQELLNINPN